MAAYAIANKADLLRHHLVLAQPDDERSGGNLAQLMR